MDFSVGGITGVIMQALGSLFNLGGLSTETGNGLLKFVEAFGMGLDWLINLFKALFSGLTKK